MIETEQPVVVRPNRRRVRRIVLRALAGLVALVLLGAVSLVAYGKIESAQPVTLPTPTGPDRVGRAVFDWTDHGRPDPYAPGHTPRELSIVVWYPANPAPGAQPGPYLPPGWTQALGNGGFFGSIARTNPDQITPHAVDNAPITDGAPHPVLVFSPGLGLSASDYTVIAEDLASHGYVVAGVNPTYSTPVVLSGNRVVQPVKAASDSGADFAALTQLWADDLRFVAGKLVELGTAAGPFQGRLDTSKIGMYGHSAGGAAATQACAQEPSCPAALDIDGYLWTNVLNTGIGKPFGFLGHEGSITGDTTQADMLNRVTRNVPAGDRHLWTVTGDTHYNFTDRTVYFNLLRSQIALLGPIDGIRASTITDAYVLAFFDNYVRHQPSPLLTGPSASYPEVTTG